VRTPRWLNRGIAASRAFRRLISARTSCEDDKDHISAGGPQASGADGWEEPRRLRPGMGGDDLDSSEERLHGGDVAPQLSPARARRDHTIRQEIARVHEARSVSMIPVSSGAGVPPHGETLLPVAPLGLLRSFKMPSHRSWMGGRR
jgi:hypothetical protein